jgi:carbamate kinase
MMQNEIARKKVPEMPLDVLGAETEGLIGYILQEQLSNKLRSKKIKRNIATLITQTLVSKKDSAFSNSTKFVGPFYTKKEADLLKNKFVIKKDSNRGYRRVVPSPKPIKIIESKIISKLISKKYIVIAAGGGGIPVILENKNLKGVEAVIDKDLSSSCLGNDIQADLLLILTDVDRVYLNYGKKNQIPVKKMKTKEAKKYMKEGQFPEGSMGPKIQAAINFLKNEKRKVIITNIENTEKALMGKTGTLITK